MRIFRKRIIWFSMLSAFFIGILFMNLAEDTYLGKTITTLEKLMTNGESENLKNSSYLYYLIKIRGGWYLVLGLLGQAFGGQIWLILYGIWFCMTEGMLLTSGFIQNRVSGIWILLLAQMPQMFLYGLVYAILLKQYVSEEKDKRKKFFYGWLMNMPIILAGILTEFYVNLDFLNWINQSVITRFGS